MQLFVILVIVLVTLIPHSHSGVPLSREDPVQPLGLYDSNDKVISLHSNQIGDLVLGQKYATLLEFYNSFCGHCRRFAPYYKQLAEDLWPWRNVVKVMAIDCAADHNNDICREYEVMAYPSLRYFSPHYRSGDKKFGYAIKTQEPENIRLQLVKLVSNETRADESWPDFSLLSDLSSGNLIKNLPEKLQYILVIYEPENSTLGAELILHYNKIEEIRIRRTVSPEVATTYKIDDLRSIAVVNRNANIENILATNQSTPSFTKVINDFLKNKNIPIDAITRNDGSFGETTSDPSNIKQDIIKEVKKQKYLVYQADLEQALRFSVFTELSKLATINGERLLALQRYVTVLRKYNPLGENGQLFLKDLEDYVLMHSQEIKGDSLEQKTNELGKQHAPIFSSSGYVGCMPSRIGLRGYTCGLWQLFHFMTVQAAENEKSTDPLEVLQAMHGYVKYFFGCTECSNHFQDMAAKNKIWNVSSKDDAVLWLWSAHNIVNKRLSGDPTEDPEFPKIQFPSRDSCKECYREDTSSVHTLRELPINDNWDKTEVLLFLKRIHSPQNISRFAIDDESVLPPTVEQLREKRMVGNVFSDMDMRMGIFLYVFCIGMMLVAVKLFLYKGYRKKVYSHDFLGKV